VRGISNNSFPGIGPYGVHGSSNSGTGVYGTSEGSNPILSHGVGGFSTHGTGVRGYSINSTGVSGTSNNNIGVRAHSDEYIGLYASSDNDNWWAGYFMGHGFFGGDLFVVGSCCGAGAGLSRIDHPLDPANKYLSHSYVESPDMMNIYNGNVTLDTKGEATVALPEWFGALNKDYRYQLTAVGAPGPNLYVSKKVENNRFSIAGGSPGMEVSWQVTGIRKAPYAYEPRPKENAQP
jgi:hypothetical protein